MKKGTPFNSFHTYCNKIEVVFVQAKIQMLRCTMVILKSDARTSSKMKRCMGSIGVLVILTTDRLAQLVEHQTAMREISGSNLGQTNTQGLKVTEENMLPL